MQDKKMSRRNMLKGAVTLAVSATVAKNLLAAEPVEAAQPHMDAALGALNQALSELNAALPDKGGHRVRAIGLVNQAINQVRMGIGAGR